MAKSRYASTTILPGDTYGAFNVPGRASGLAGIDLLEGVRTVSYTVQRGDRADHLAARYFNDDSLWWLICLVNTIPYPFASGGFEPGRELRIPVDPRDVLDKIMR